MFLPQVQTMDLTEGARTAVTQCLAVQEGEEVLIVTDDERARMADALRTASKEAGAETMLLTFDGTGESGTEPPAVVKEALKASDAFVIPTTHSLSHTDARVEACEAGARGATMPGITEEVFTGAMVADYQDIRRRTEALYERVQGVDEVHVTSPSGTDIRMKVDTRYWETDTGLVHDPGDFSNLPAGEIYGIPIQAEGQIVFDSFNLSGEEKAPPGTVVEIENSIGTSVSEACRLQEAFRNVENATNLAELGIGTNPAAEVIGNMLQDEKALGTCHFAFGDNTAFGGETGSSIHWDGIVQDPTIRFDDTVIMEDGEFRVDV
jgi:leucyl aminopeptidase (aminopeptidase T)